MEVVNYDKLLKAIQLVVYNKLDECQDDTLIEKLMTLFDNCFNKMMFPNDHIKLIFNVCKKSIEDWKVEYSRVCVSPVFSFMFKLLSSFDIQMIIGKDIIIQEINQLLNLKSKVFHECDYSIQFNFIKGLTKLFLDQQGSIIVFKESLIDESFVENLISFGIKSKSFFVKESIQKCLVELLKRASECQLNYFPIIASSFEFELNKIQVKIISQLIHDNFRSTIMQQLPDLNQKLMAHINYQTDQNVTIQLVELLAINIENESEINFVFMKLIKNKLLKPLITFSANLAATNSNYLNRWFTYVVLPLKHQIDENDLKSDNHFNYSEFDRLFVQSLTNEKTIIFCLHYMKIKFPKCLNDKQLIQTFEIIDQFVSKAIQLGKIKILREALLMIGNLGKQLNNLDSKLYAILVDLFINLIWSENFQSECLIWLRHLFENESNVHANNQEIKIKLINLIDELLKLKLDNENFDIIDGGLELLCVLTKRNHLKLNELNESILKSIFEIWNYSIQCFDNYSLKISCISILPILLLQLDQSIPNELVNKNLSKFTENLEVSFSSNIFQEILKCLKDENSLIRRKVIESIKDCFLHNENLKEQVISILLRNDGELYLSVCYYLSESILFDIDADIQLAAINVLKNLIYNIAIKSKLNDLIDSDDKISRDKIFKLKFQGLIYFVHCLYLTISNNLVCLTVKDECLNVLMIIKTCLNENLVKKDDLLSTFSNMESIFKYEVKSNRSYSNVNHLPINIDEKNRDEQLDKMFQNNSFQTKELIFQLNNERIEDKKNSFENEKSFDDYQLSISKTITINNLLEFLYTFESRTILENEIKFDFLDDILAAKVRDDVIIDCY